MKRAVPIKGERAFFFESSESSESSDLSEFSAILLIAFHGPNCHERGDGEEGSHLVSNALESAAAHKHSADGINEIVHGIHVGGGISP